MFQTNAVDKIKTHFFVFNNCFSENRSVYEIMWKNAGATQATDNNIIRRMRFACWITQAIDTQNI